ncbi:MAG: stage V sporulation protein AD [Clostridiales bacterium]|nr:stage V sporulation protein AD [Clostridiales bacterium]
MARKLGQQTIVPDQSITVLSAGCAVGKKEGEGPLRQYFDHIDTDDTFGQDSWENAEIAMQKHALSQALDKAALTAGQLDWLFAGDLLNQCVCSSFAARDLPLPFFGLYGACSTMGEGLCLSSLVLDGGGGQRAAVLSSSHFCSAERQYRTPLEYGCQRTPTAQWTVTGSGAVILSRGGTGPRITHITPGKIVDKGIRDTNNMGAAMAPAAWDTIRTHLNDTGRAPGFYDLIVTGDLGRLGSELLKELARRDGVTLDRHADCGLLIFEPNSQDVHCGGSGCGCCASVLASFLLPGLREGKWKNILFCPTGALHSPTTAFQGESIPGISHAVAISAE